MEIVVDRDAMIVRVQLTPAEARDRSPKKMDALVTEKGLMRTSPWVYDFSQANRYLAEVTKPGVPRVGSWLF